MFSKQVIRDLQETDENDDFVMFYKYLPSPDEPADPNALIPIPPTPALKSEIIARSGIPSTDLPVARDATMDDLRGIPIRKAQS